MFGRFHKSQNKRLFYELELPKKEEKKTLVCKAEDAAVANGRYRAEKLKKGQGFCFAGKFQTNEGFE